MTNTLSTHEAKVRGFYHGKALQAYSELMGDFWHHGSLEDHIAGVSPTLAAQRQEEFLIDQAGLSQEQLVMDFGSGPGGGTIHQGMYKQVRVVGISNDEKLSAHARSLAEKENATGRINFVTVGDLDYLRLPWPDGSFDAITFYESPCHLTRKPEFFQEMYRLVKVGGRMVGMDWIQRPSPFRDQTPEDIQDLVEPVCEHICLASLETVESYTSMIRAAGFAIILAEDMYPGVACWGSTPDEDRDKWHQYEDEGIRAGKRALDALRESGNFSVAQFVAEKRATP